MADNYDPNLGVLSAFEGVGNAISQVGQLGLVDALENRRSKMEHGLRMKLKGADQEFESEQTGVKHGNAMDLLEREYELKGKFEGDKAKAVYDKDLASRELLSPDGKTLVKLDDVRKIYADSNGLNADMIDWDRMEPDFNKWIDKQGYQWRNQQPTPPMEEATARERLKLQYPDATDDQINKTIESEIKAGRIKASAAVTEPGVMDAVAAEGGGTPAGEFAGGEPGGEPGALAATEEKAADHSYEGWKDKATHKKKRDQLQAFKMDLAKQGFPAGTGRGGVSKNKKRNAKIEKATKQVEAAIKKGNVRQVSKENLKIALNNDAFVAGLDLHTLNALIEYMSEGNGR